MNSYTLLEDFMMSLAHVLLFGNFSQTDMLLLLLILCYYCRTITNLLTTTTLTKINSPQTPSELNQLYGNHPAYKGTGQGLLAAVTGRATLCSGGNIEH